MSYSNQRQRGRQSRPAPPKNALPYSYEDYTLAAQILDAIPKAHGMRPDQWTCDSPGSEECVEAGHYCHDIMVAVATLLAKQSSAGTEPTAPAADPEPKDG